MLLHLFTEKRFSGNPAAVCPLSKWLPDETLQAIAAENNLSETAFFVGEGEIFNLRWFTPKVAMAYYLGFPARELRKLEALTTENQKELLEAWNEYFGT